MDVTLFIVYIVAIGYLGITMYLANVEQLNWHENRGGARSLLFVAPGLVALLGLYSVLIATSATQINEVNATSPDAALIPE